MDLKKEMKVLRADVLRQYGTKNKFVQPFDEQLILKLRNVFYGGIPASLILFIKHYTDGKCDERPPLLSLGLEDFTLVAGNIDSLREKGDNPFHQWVESNGWVYDTTLGIKIKREFYYLCEHPEILLRRTKKECLQYQEYQILIRGSHDSGVGILPLIVPLIEKMIADNPASYLISELQRFKEEVRYDQLYQDYRAELTERGIFTTN